MDINVYIVMSSAKTIYQHFPIRKNKVNRVLDFLKLLWSSQNDFLKTIDYLEKQKQTGATRKAKPRVGKN
jgi:hypothetical protein